MPLNAGDSNASSGLAKAIATSMDKALRPALEQAGMSDAQINSNILPQWQRLSYAIASGIVSEITGDASVTPDYAQSYSSQAQDGFWAWLSGFIGVFQTWAPTTPDGVALQTALKAFLNAHPAPTELKGIVR